jgi:dethiobiotin synthetase
MNLTSLTLRPGLFVTGTDTGVGKTTLASALLRAASDAGLRVVPFKPAETGCAPNPDDAFQLWEAARATIARDAVCLHALPLPAAPQAAADAAGVSIRLEPILERADHLAQEGDALLVEGAGGLLVPYAPGLTGADLAAHLHLPVLLVARTGLGTINHVALSVAEIRRRQLPFAGVVMVDTVPERQPHEPTNAALIESLTGIRPSFTFPHIDPPRTVDDLARALRATPGGQRLIDLLRPRPNGA